LTGSYPDNRLPIAAAAAVADSRAAVDSLAMDSRVADSRVAVADNRVVDSRVAVADNQVVDSRVAVADDPDYFPFEICSFRSLLHDEAGLLVHGFVL